MTSTVRSTSESGYLPGSAAYRRLSIALFAAGLATFALLYCVQALLPLLSEQFSLPAAESTWALSVTTIGMGASLLVIAVMGETISRTRLMHASLAASSVMALACAVAPSWAVLLLFRLVLGLTLAGLPAVATTYLREELHLSIHARAAGLYIGGTAIGGMSGRLLAGAVAEAAGWRWALAAVAVLGLFCTATVRATLLPSRHFVPATASYRNLFMGLRRAVTQPGLLALYGIGGASMGAFVAMFNALGFRLAGPPFHLGLGAASLVFLVYPVGTVSSVMAGRLADTRGRPLVVLVGALIAMVGIVITWAPQLVVVVIGLAVFTAGFFVVHGVASGWVPALASARGVGPAAAMSMYLFLYYVGSSLFGTLAGHAWTADGWRGVVVLASALYAVVAALALTQQHEPTVGASVSARRN